MALVGEISSAKMEPPKPKKFIMIRFQKKTRRYMEVRLNSPCGKFKLTNTADDQVDLTPGNIPDAGFSEEEIEKLIVAKTKVLVKMPP